MKRCCEKLCNFADSKVAWWCGLVVSVSYWRPRVVKWLVCLTKDLVQISKSPWGKHWLCLDYPLNSTLVTHFSIRRVNYNWILSFQWDPAFRDQRLDDHDQRKTRSPTRSRIAEMGHFLQITIVRKTRPFLNKTYTISPDRKLQKWATFCKLRSQEKLYNFSWSRIAEMVHFLQITIARKTLPFLKKNYGICCDSEMQKWATFCKLRSQEKLYHFSRKTIQSLVIANCRNGSLSANYDRKKN